MTTGYPGALDSYSVKVDNVTDVKAADINDPQDAIVAIETELGTDPAGGYTDVKDRLEAIDTDDWVDWTPTVTQSGAVTVTIAFAKYQKVGHTVHIQARLNVTGAGTGANAISIGGQPADIQTSAAGGLLLGSAIIYDSGTAYYHGGIAVFGATDWRFRGESQSTFFGVTPNFALANNDIIWLNGTYYV